MNDLVSLKILDKLGNIEDEMKELKQEMNQKHSELRQEMNQKHEELKQEMNQKHEELKQEINQKQDELKQELLDKLFLFEHEYGEKIVSIFDFVKLQADKDKAKTERIQNLETRTERNEMKILNFEERIDKVELDKVTSAVKSS